jgi:hypothetical protein
MSDTLALLTDKIQAALGDDGTYFSDALCTAAVRAALSEINERAPVHSSQIVDVSAGQKIYEVSLVDERAMTILNVLKQDTTGQDDQPLNYDPFTEDSRLWFRLRTALSSGYLVVNFTIPHTIAGLDSETESSLPAHNDAALISGAVYHACLIRSVSRVEGNNLDKSTSDNYMQIAKMHRLTFDTALDRMAAQLPPVGEPGGEAWNDPYFGRTA